MTRATAPPPRWLLLALVAMAGAVLLATALTVRPGAGPASAGEATIASPTPPAPAGPLDGAGPRDVLIAWDRSRAEAWARGDVTQLQGLYAPGAPAGLADVAMLRRWTSRGMRVADVRMRLLRFHTVAATSGRLEVVVLDQEVGATARPLHPDQPAFATTLPRDQPTRHRLVLVRERDGPWRMASVR